MANYETDNFIDTQKMVWNYSLFSKEDIELFQTGKHHALYKVFGAHPITVLNQNGFYFSVWAPNAKYVSVIGDFNGWKEQLHPLTVRQDSSGIWEGFIPNIEPNFTYKFHIKNKDGFEVDKGDPFARFWQKRPETASITWNNWFDWDDTDYMSNQYQKNKLEAPWSVYEVHLSSWKRPDGEENTFHTYEYLIENLVPYVKEMGFSHVELMPVMEHPYDGSWGYQGTGYFAPTSRFGEPQDFKKLVAAFHNNGIGVILDWVPSHFPYDTQGLYRFDGSHVYEYADSRKGYHPDWNSYIFNYGRAEVRSFLISSACFWIDEYHADGLRVDAVSSILRLDFSRGEGQWEPNIYGGNGNLEAIEFIKDMNSIIYKNYPNVQTIAEESSDWPKISKPIYDGGLGFGMKWMMGWMHDTFDYFKLDPLTRKNHQNDFTFSLMYFYDEQFMLPISHDEVVHGKSPMLYKMPGDEWQKFANLRLLYTYMWMHPGAKLLFMGCEFAQSSEWKDAAALNWSLLEFDAHKKMQQMIKDLNYLYNTEKALHELQFNPKGFEWIAINKIDECILAFQRNAIDEKENIIAIFNMTPVVRKKVVLNVKNKKNWKEIFNSDSSNYWGTNTVYNTTVDSLLKKGTKNEFTITIDLPALGAILLK